MRAPKDSPEVFEKKKQFLLGRGWEARNSRDSCWFVDPITGESVSFREALRRQEEGEPGSLPTWK
jgi:hypothetical protein